MQFTPIARVSTSSLLLSGRSRHKREYGKPRTLDLPPLSVQNHFEGARTKNTNFSSRPKQHLPSYVEQWSALLPAKVQAYLLSVFAILIGLGVGFPLIALTLKAAKNAVEQRRLAIRLYSDASESVVPRLLPEKDSESSLQIEEDHLSTDPAVWSQPLRSSIGHHEAEHGWTRKTLEGFGSLSRLFLNHPYWCTVGLAIFAPCLTQLAAEGSLKVLVWYYRRQVNHYRWNRSKRDEVRPKGFSSILTSAPLKTSQSEATRSATITWKELKRKRLKEAGVVPLDAIANYTLQDSAKRSPKDHQGNAVVEADQTPTACVTDTNKFFTDVLLQHPTSCSSSSHKTNISSQDSAPPRSMLFLPQIVAGQQEGPRPGIWLLTVAHIAHGTNKKGHALFSIGIAGVIMVFWVVLALVDGRDEYTEGFISLLPNNLGDKKGEEKHTSRFINEDSTNRKKVV